MILYRINYLWKYASNKRLSYVLHIVCCWNAPLTLHLFPCFLVVLSILKIYRVHLVHFVWCVDLPIILHQVKWLFYWTPKLLYCLTFSTFVQETSHVILGNFNRILCMNNITIFRPLISLLLWMILRQEHRSISAFKSRTKPFAIFILWNLWNFQLLLQFGRVKVLLNRDPKRVLEID